MYPMFPFTQNQQKTINYVNGRSSVESAYLPPNSGDVYLDTTSNKFFIKQTDSNGIPTIESYDYKKSEVEKPKEYVTKEEFEAFKAKMRGGRNESNSNSNGK